MIDKTSPEYSQPIRIAAKPVMPGLAKAPLSPQPKKEKERLIAVENLKKSFLMGEQEDMALRGATLDIFDGDFAIIYGPSGSGKSTLLNMLIGLELPTSGTIMIDNIRLDQLSDDQRAAVRMKYFGVVYQQAIWIKALSVEENIALPLMIGGLDHKSSLARARTALANVGMDDFSSHRPTELSGGQQQRLSLARSLVLDPPILVLDEPTGNLDTHNADKVIELLQNLNQKQNRTIIMVTHNMIYLPVSNNKISVKDGVINKQEVS